MKFITCWLPRLGPRSAIGAGGKAPEQGARLLFGSPGQGHGDGPSTLAQPPTGAGGGGTSTGTRQEIMRYVATLTGSSSPSSVLFSSDHPPFLLQTLLFPLPLVSILPTLALVYVSPPSFLLFSPRLPTAVSSRFVDALYRSAAAPVGDARSFTVDG